MGSCKGGEQQGIEIRTPSTSSGPLTVCFTQGRSTVLRKEPWAEPCSAAAVFAFPPLSAFRPAEISPAGSPTGGPAYVKIEGAGGAGGPVRVARQSRQVANRGYGYGVLKLDKQFSRDVGRSTQ
jgi:hypothetical protein